MTTLNNTVYPTEIKRYIYNLLAQEAEFVGEKPIKQGYIIKRNKDKATVTYDDGENIYAVKLAKHKNDWRVIGVASIWDNIQELLKME